MNFLEHQQQAMRTIREDYDCLEHYIPKLFTEIAELLDAFMKHKVYGATLDRVNVLEELGDYCWYKANIFRVLGWDDFDPKRVLPVHEKRIPFDMFLLSAVQGSEVLRIWLEHGDRAADLFRQFYQLERTLTWLINHFDSTWDEVRAMNITKLRTRYPKKYTSELAIARDVEAEREALAAEFNLEDG